MLNIANISKSYNARYLFSGVSFNVGMGDRIAVMRDGRIVQIGTPEDILTDPANDYVEQFEQDVDRTRVLTAANVMELPRPVVGEGAGPRTALRQMRDAYMSAVYVVDRERRLLGIVSDHDALRLVQKGATILASALGPVPQSVRDDEVLMNLFVPAVESRLPLAVTDAEGRLVERLAGADAAAQGGDHQRLRVGRQDLGALVVAQPHREGHGLEVNLVEAHGLHLRLRPLNGLGVRRGAGQAHASGVLRLALARRQLDERRRALRRAAPGL